MQLCRYGSGERMYRVLYIVKINDILAQSRFVHAAVVKNISIRFNGIDIHEISELAVLQRKCVQSLLRYRYLHGDVPRAFVNSEKI